MANAPEPATLSFANPKSSTEHLIASRLSLGGLRDRARRKRWLFPAIPQGDDAIISGCGEVFPI